MGSASPTDVRSSEWGLLHALGLAYFAALMSLSAIAAIQWKLGGTPWIVGTLLVLLMLLPPIVVERTPRFDYVFEHLRDYASFTRNGLEPSFVRDHNWPGFFITLSTLATAGGIQVLDLAVWAPFVVMLLSWFLGCIACKVCGADNRRAWLGGFLLLAFNWIGQDYLSLQAMGFLVYLLGIIFLLPIGREPVSGRVYVLLVLTSTTLTIVHLLSGLLFLLVLFFVLVQSKSAMKIAVPMGIFLVWQIFISTFVVTKGSQPLRQLVAFDFESIFNSIHSSSSHLAISRSAVHNALANVKLASAFLAGLLSLIAWFAWRPRRKSALTVAGVAPASFLAFGPYGGEIIFRAYMFSSVAGSIAISTARRLPRFLPILLLLFLPLMHVIDHFGNDFADATDTSDLQGGQFLVSKLPSSVAVFPAGSLVVEAFAHIVLDVKQPHAAEVWTQKAALATRFLGGNRMVLDAQLVQRDRFSCQCYDNGSFILFGLVSST